MTTMMARLRAMAAEAPTFGEVEPVLDRAGGVALGWLVAHPDGYHAPVCRRCRYVFTAQPAKALARYVLRRHAETVHDRQGT